MKTLSCAVLLAIQSLACRTDAQVVYQRDFSGTNAPAFSKETLGATEFHQAWTVAGSLENAAGNQYARYDLTVPYLPASPAASWCGGFFMLMPALDSLPAQWQCSFDISLPSLEPVRVSLIEKSDSFPSSTPARVYWVQPAGLGWQSIVINQDTPYSLASTPRGGSVLLVQMASHDAGGKPLSLAQIGTHNFRLDNVRLELVPEPGVFALSLLALLCLSAAGNQRSRG